ncbi:FixH family protein [Gracilibacillus sp. D59]|uniref:FixH family protein n=1 Tax=Gracilibacillus sp. D59 TaxID=3457434 RepID=UPI003FCDB34A
MKKRFIIIILCTLALTACASQAENDEQQQEDVEVKGIHVEFELPKQAKVGESVLLQTTVTYGEDELVTDAEEMKFEYWKVDDEKNTVSVEATNHEDGTYSSEVKFEEPGTYEIYAHTTAKGLHTMPKKAITITGEQQENHDQESQKEEANAEHEHQQEFEIMLNPLGEITVNQELEITIKLAMDQQPYKNARVRYEIIPENSEKHDWIETEEINAGEYVNSYTFKKAGQAKMIVHVTDDTGLHEHKEFQLEVNE